MLDVGERETFDSVTTLCDMVAETDLLPAMKMNTTEKSSSPEPIFYDDEDTALLLHCKLNKLFKRTACLA